MTNAMTNAMSDTTSDETTSGEDRAARSDVITDWRYSPTNSPHAR